jgi:MraZ protein
MLLGTSKGVPLTQEGLLLPPHLREGLEQGYVITRGLDGCVAVFPLSVWEALLKRIEGGTSFLKAAARAFQRHLFGGASVATLESEGLIPIPEYLRRFAGLGDEVVLIGVGDRLEIWNAHRWSHEEYRVNERSLRSSEELSELGI